MSSRRILLELFDAAVRAVDGRECVSRYLVENPPTGRAHVFAVGKAASAMTRGAYDALGRLLERALVITKDGHVDPEIERIAGVMAMECAHPVPDYRSLDAGQTLLAEVRALPADVLPLFLVSGGASSLVEVLREGVSLEALRQLNVRGLAAGWSIEKLNTERSALSILKRGGIARLLNGRPALALFVSDVAGDDPEVIGSGLLGRDAGRPDHIARHIVANVDSAVRGVLQAANERGLKLRAVSPRFNGEATIVAARFVSELRNASHDGLVWGGESTVTLPADAGRGGRNTHLALSAAHMLSGDPRLAMLAAGTDGTDGPTGDAGGIVDGETILRAELGGCDAEQALAAANSGAALAAAGDLLHTGPTGTNVGDILIGLRSGWSVLRGDPTARML